MEIELLFRPCFKCGERTCQIPIEVRKDYEHTRCTLCQHHNFFDVMDKKATPRCE